jgi:hypothetical protein
MAVVTPGKLRESAHIYRSMASSGSDMHLQVALLQLADDFELEAADLEAHLATVAPDAKEWRTNRP